MKLSESAIEFLEAWEGVRLHAYRDQAGKMTIGIGHLLKRDEIATGIVVIDGEPVSWRNGITEDQAHALKRQDADPIEKSVSLMFADLSQHEFDALVILAFNIGTHALSTSSVVRNLRGGDKIAAAKSFGLYNKVRVNGGLVVSEGLVKRRAAETQIFRFADYRGRP